MALAKCLVPLLAVSFVLCPTARGEGFLDASKHRPQALDKKAWSTELQAAMGSVLGCGGEGSGRSDRAAIAAAIHPIWLALPKTGDRDRIEWPWLRYMANRYFMQQSSFLIRGLEPAQQVNTEHAQILSEHAPALVNMMLEGKEDGHGYSFEDAVALMATIHQVISHSEASLLEKLYPGRMWSGKLHETVSHDQLQSTLELFVIHWIFGDDAEAVLNPHRGQTADISDEYIPHWAELRAMINGTIKSIAFQRARSPKVGQMPLVDPTGYSFEDAHEAVDLIGKSFSGFWEQECQEIKTHLVALDKAGTGRVRLRDFYNANAEGEWRFAESEEYLQKLGALETSSWRGKQVIIPNYLQAASNCIVSRPGYLVCCANECEGILTDVEALAGASVAEPNAILELVGNMTGFDDAPVKINTAMRQQLLGIAETYGGKVPVHGRLFAQWLHYMFPHECPFPHKAGVASIVTPHEFGAGYVASPDDLRNTDSEKNQSTTQEDEVPEDLQWMSQWSEEEELPGDYAGELRPGSQRGGLLIGCGALLMVALAVVKVVDLPIKAGIGKDEKSSILSGSQYRCDKSHFV